MITARWFLSLLAAGFSLLAIGFGLWVGFGAGLALGGGLMAAWSFIASQVSDS